MKTFTFRLFEGYKVHLDEKDVTIDFAGSKWLFITTAKPRKKTIPYNEILRVEYKEAGMKFGYVRFITKENEEYISSTYVAEADERAFMVEKDEHQKLSDVLDVLKKKCKDIPFIYMKA